MVVRMYFLVKDWAGLKWPSIATPRKMKQWELKSLQTTSLCYSNATCKSTPKVPLTFNKLEKTKLENFDFGPLLSFFLLPQG